MKAKIWCCVMAIAAMAALSGCSGKMVDKKQVEADIQEYARDTNMFVENIEAVQAVARGEDGCEVTVPVTLVNDQVRYHGEMYLQYYKIDKSWDPHLVMLKNDYEITPLAGVDKNRSQKDAMTFDIVAEERRYALDSFQQLEVDFDTQNTDLDGLKDVVTYRVRVTQAPTFAEGTVKVTYQFVQGKWKLQSVEQGAQDDFQIQYLPGLEPPSDIPNSVLEGKLSPDPKKVDAYDRLGDITVGELKSASFGSQMVYPIRFVTKSNAIDAYFTGEVRYQFKDRIGWQVDRVSTEFDRFDMTRILGVWEGSWSYASDPVTITIDEADGSSAKGSFSHGGKSSEVDISLEIIDNNDWSMRIGFREKSRNVLGVGGVWFDLDIDNFKMESDSAWNGEAEIGMKR